MKNEDFYTILSKELETLITQEAGGEKFKSLKQEEQKHAYALLIWFLDFYAGIKNTEKYITDGHGDNSCDIILDRKSSQGETIFYLVQSKWNSIANCNKEFDSTELKSYLSDVHSILRGDKEETKNTSFNSRYKDLLAHIRKNGRVKVLYLTLRNTCSDAQENINSLEKTLGGNIKVEGFDINKLKMDYISRHYKKSTPPNPLEHIYNPEFEKIIIEVLKDEENNHIEINKPFEAHVFNVKPSLVFRLVERYGVSLFDKNVRNPLISSTINNEIKSSLRKNPAYFWYYNNGITAISRRIPPISNQASSFEVIGLQIINGAQTAYSIYKAYEESSIEERELIDAEARITLRLLKSGGQDFDLHVTKYTNSQNPVSERDFWSNDQIQENIQNFFYETNIWYEKRSGEFRKTPDGVIKIPNSYIASAYLAFWLNDPVSVFKASLSRDDEGVDLIFTSHKDNKDGLYETIFNSETNMEAMLAAFCMFDILTDRDGFEIPKIFYSNGFHILALSKIIISKYLSVKYDKSINVLSYIYKKYQKNEINEIRKCLVYVSKLMKEEIENKNDEEKEYEAIQNIMTKKSYFDIMLDKIEKLSIEPNDIDSIELKEETDTTQDDHDKDKLEEKEAMAIH
ncbi:AIPR family protein [Thiothrix unzii]|jgi:hypothetical protein|uniref:AIPR family protein n=1 Tax=Thiothrix unzii TaxID=111769 RepID=UPI002A365B50|nr:AIPR family protein [Thiothrix unzii]MDX9988679.1 AIPR family protein [Thiothrix unzii]